VLAIVCPFSECFVASKNHTVAACFSSRLPIYTTWRDAAVESERCRRHACHGLPSFHHHSLFIGGDGCPPISGCAITCGNESEAADNSIDCKPSSVQPYRPRHVERRERSGAVHREEHAEHLSHSLAFSRGRSSWEWASHCCSEDFTPHALPLCQA